MNLSDVIIKDPDLTAWVEFKNGIEFNLRYVSKAALVKIARACTVYRYDSKQKGRVPEVDQDKMAESYCSRAVIGWRGATLARLQNLIPMNLSKMTKEQLEQDLEFNQTNLLDFLKVSDDLDVFLQEACSNLAVFNASKEDEEKNS